MIETFLELLLGVSHNKFIHGPWCLSHNSRLEPNLELKYK